MATRITRSLFSGSSKIFDGTLADAVRGLAQDLARTKVQNAGLADFTDSSTGTADATFVDLTLPAAAYDATSSGGAQRAAVNTAIGKTENALAVIVGGLNNARARIGLSALGFGAGTIASAMVIPAQDLTITTSNGTSALDYVSGKAAMRQIRQNMWIALNGFNELRVALGYTPITLSLAGDLPTSLTDMVTVADADASATGASSIAKTVADTFFTAMGANIATLAAQWNYMFIGGAITDLTDSSGGTAAAGLAANTIPVAADGAATTSAPKTGFDTELGKIENNLSDLTARMNLLRGLYGLSQYTDSTGVSSNTTIEALTVALTAVDGSTGTDAVDQTTGRARITTIHNALSSLAAGINELVDYYGVAPLTDLVAGTASETIANIAATATGVAGVGATLLDTAVDAWLVINRHNIATLAAKLNAITGTGIQIEPPLSVVAV